MMVSVLWVQISLRKTKWKWEVEEGGKMSCKGAAVLKRDEILNEEIVLTPHPVFTRRYTRVERRENQC